MLVVCLPRRKLSALILAGLVWSLPQSGVVAQPNLETARALLERGDWFHATPLLTGSDWATRLTLLEATVDGGDFDRAQALHDELARGETKPSNPEQAYRLALAGGRLARSTRDLLQAERRLRSALALASSAEQKLVALDELLASYGGEKRWEKAETVLSEAQLLLAEELDGLSVARHTYSLGEYQRERGKVAEAESTFVAARTLFNFIDLPLLALEARISQISIASQLGDDSRARELALLALIEAEKTGNDPAQYHAIEQVIRTTMQAPIEDDPAGAQIEKALSNMAPGDWKQIATADFLLYRHQQVGQAEEAADEARKLLARPDLGVDGRLRVLFFLSAHLSGKGQAEQALQLLDDAIALSPRRVLTQESGYGEGELLLHRAAILRRLHRYDEALESVHRGKSLVTGAQWHTWRVLRAGYEAVLSIMPTYDMAALRREVRTSLDEAEADLTVSDQAWYLTLILNTLLGQREMDTPDPAEVLLGPYSPMARSVLDEILRPPGALERYIKVYDAWIAELREASRFSTEFVALDYKATFFEAAGKPAEARAAILEAIRVAQERGLRDNEISSYISLTRLENLQGRPQAALEALTQAGRLSRQVPSYRGVAHIALASYQRQNGQLEASLKNYDLALEADPKRGWSVMHGKALALLDLGRTQEALSAVDQALQSKGLDGHPVSRAILLAQQGKLLTLAGKAKEALSRFETSLPTLLAWADSGAAQSAALDYGRTLESLGQSETAYEVSRQALDTLMGRGGIVPAALSPLFERVATLALKTGHQEEALRYLDLSRSAELVGTVRLDQIPHQNEATRELLSKLDELKVRLQSLQEEAGRQDDEASRKALSTALSSTRGEFFAKLDELKRSEPDFQALVGLSGSDLAAVQSHLDDETALVEYFSAEDALYIFIVTRQGFRMQQVSIGRGALLKMVSTYGSLVRDPDSSLDALAVSSRALFGLLIEPLAAVMKDRPKLLVVPSGSLWHVAFEELRDGVGRSLDETHEVGLLTSADLLRTMARPEDDKGLPARRVLLGAPDAVDLPGAASELKALAKLMPGSTSLSGSKATSEALRTSAQRADLLHIASHSGVGAVPDKSYVQLADGPFRLEQIYGLSLRAGALVVLSSCQSALGEKDPGREVTSLASAFNVAGASTVIASHWEVDDAVTAQLFTSFYGHLAQGKGRGEALRLARREVAKAHPHPYYWAAFSIFGDTR